MKTLLNKDLILSKIGKEDLFHALRLTPSQWQYFWLREPRVATLFKLEELTGIPLKELVTEVR